MYVKLFSQILCSSIWDESNETRITWITLLAMADEDGFVHTTDKALAMMARLDDVTLRNALRVLQAPDPESGTPDFDGRRIEKSEGGYLILNYVKYKETRTKDELREQVRRRVAAYRGRQKENDVTHGNACNECNHTQAHTQAHKEEEDASPRNGDVTKCNGDNVTCNGAYASASASSSASPDGESEGKAPILLLGTNTLENHLMQTYRQLHGTTGNPQVVLAKIQSALSYGVRADAIEKALYDWQKRGIKAEIWDILDPLVKAQKQEPLSKW